MIKVLMCNILFMFVITIIMFVGFMWIIIKSFIYELLNWMFGYDQKKT